MARSFLRLGALALASAVGMLGAGCDSCRSGGAAPDGAPIEAPGASSADGAVSPGDEEREEPEATGEGDAAAGPRADAGGPACSGREIDALAALADPRCAITAREARRLRAVSDDAGAAAAFIQRATADEDGTVVVRVTNAGTRTVTVPLLDHPDLPAFTALAQQPNGTIFELAPPSFALDERAAPADAGARDGGTTDGGAVRRARIAKARVPRGGAVVLRLVPSPTVLRRIAPPCPADGGTCAPGRLAPGAYVLHLGQLVADVESGAPARVAFLFR